MLAECPAGVVAVEVNLSCPNLDGGAHLFAHDAERSAAVVAAVSAAAGRPCWAKLSPNTDRLVAVAAAVRDAGAEAVTCVNTLLGLAYDQHTAAPALGAGGGGLSGPAIHPVAVRAVHDVAVAVPGLPIIGVGGVRTALGRRRDGARRCVGGPGGHGDLRRPPERRSTVLLGRAPPGVIPGAGRDLRYRCHHGYTSSLTPEQRAAALEKAKPKRVRAGRDQGPSQDGHPPARSRRSTSDDPNVGKLKVVSLLESLPGVGKVKARKVMDEIGIATTAVSRVWARSSARRC